MVSMPEAFTTCLVSSSIELSATIDASYRAVMSAKMRAVVCAAISGEDFAFQRDILRVTSDMIRLLSDHLAGVADLSTYWIRELKVVKRNLSCAYLPPDARIAEGFRWF
jgi:hypothetical protein